MKTLILVLVLALGSLGLAGCGVPAAGEAFKIEGTVPEITIGGFTNTGVISSTGTITSTGILTGTNVCVYRESYLDAVGTGDPDQGISVSAGSKIEGPAIAQIDAKSAVAIYPGASWTPASKVVTWMYQGDELCLEAQFPYFPGKNIIPVH